jgi:hypothetical protein
MLGVIEHLSPEEKDELFQEFLDSCELMPGYKRIISFQSKKVYDAAIALLESRGIPFNTTSFRGPLGGRTYDISVPEEFRQDQLIIDLCKLQVSVGEGDEN